MDRHEWKKTNCALARLLACHHKELKAAVAIAVEIGRGIDGLTEQMAALCIRTCRFCPEPCCITNTVWFDFRDLLLFHLLGRRIPACQAVSDVNDACPFLSHRGCRLPLRNRPWMCIQYICPAQLTLLETRRFPVAMALQQQLEMIERQRATMEAQVVCRIKHRKKAPEKKKSAFSNAKQKSRANS